MTFYIVHVLFALHTLQYRAPFRPFSKFDSKHLFLLLKTKKKMSIAKN